MVNVHGPAEFPLVIAKFAGPVTLEIIGCPVQSMRMESITHVADSPNERAYTQEKPGPKAVVSANSG